MRPLLVLLRHLGDVIAHPATAIQGFAEGPGDLGVTYDDDAYSPRSVAYDVGRNLRRWGH